MQNTIKAFACIILGGATALGSASIASAKTLTVSAADNIYGVGQTSAPGGGNVPTGYVRVPTGAMCMIVHSAKGSLSCSAASGCIALDDTGGDHLNDADGVGAAPATSSNSGNGSISGITAPYAGYLVALFTPKGGPAGEAPARAGLHADRHEFHECVAIDRPGIFRRRRQDGKPERQNAENSSCRPEAKTLTFGISDACNYNGSPGCYDDNDGAYTVKVQITTKPCD